MNLLNIRYLYMLFIAHQLYKNGRSNESRVWLAIKLAFNFQILRVYLSAVVPEIVQIKATFENVKGQQDTLLEFLEENLFYLALFVFVGMLFMLLFLRTLQQNSVKIKHLPNLPLIEIFGYGLKSLVQTMIFQAFVFGIVMYFHILNPIDQMKLLRMSYIRMLLLLSAVSSLGPIITILVERPIVSFYESFQVLQQRETIDYNYVQLQSTEFCEELNSSSTEYPESILLFDEEVARKSSITLFSRIKTAMRAIWTWVLKHVTLLYRLSHCCYCFIQMLFAFIVVLALICIVVETLNPKINILSSLNAIDFFAGSETQQSSAQTALLAKYQPVLIFIFKIVFIIMMYLASQNCIKYKQSKGIINDVNNIVVIVRKGLLNFSLIGLLTTLYPNLTMTTNNSDCFRNIKYVHGVFYENGTNPLSGECPVTVIGLLKMKLFEGTSVTAIGLIVLLLYIVYAGCIIGRLLTLRKNS